MEHCPSMTGIAIWPLVTQATDQQFHLGCKLNVGKRLKNGNRKQGDNLNRKKNNTRDHEQASRFSLSSVQERGLDSYNMTV